VGEKLKDIINFKLEIEGKVKILLSWMIGIERKIDALAESCYGMTSLICIFLAHVSLIPTFPIATSNLIA
jgi:hypothetical protein